MSCGCGGAAGGGGFLLNPPNSVRSPFGIFNTEGYKARLTFDTSEAFNLLMNTSPPGACVDNLAGLGAGNLTNGAYTYKITFVTATGETDGGTTSGGVTVVDAAVDGQVALTSIPTGPTFVTSRKIYRTVAGGTQHKLVATIADNTTTTYTDNIADAALGANVPTANTTLDARLSVSNTGQVMINHAGATTVASLAFGVSTRGITAVGGLALLDPTALTVIINGTSQFYIDNDEVRMRSNTGFSFTDGTAASGTPDAVLTRAAAGVMLLAGASGGVAALRQSGGNGSYLSRGVFTELLTIAAAAFTDTATLIAANAVVLAVAVRVVTVIPTAATFTVTGAVSATVFNTAAVAVAAGSTDPGTAAGAYFNAANQAIRITPNVAPAAGTGQVRVVCYTYTAVPPTA